MNRIKRAPIVALMVIAGVSTVQAQDREIDALKARVVQLEVGKSNNWQNNIKFGGLLEFQAVAGEEYNGDSYSDLDVATVEFAIGSKINQYINANLSFLYEEDATDFDIDEASISFADKGKSPLSLTFGQIYLPFGSFDTGLVNDTLTLELGETLQTAVLFGFEQDEIDAAFYLFDGDIDHPNTVETWGFSVGYTMETFKAGFDYISSIADTDGMAAVIGSPNLLDDSAAGISLHGSITQGPLLVMFEYIAATSAIEYSNGAEIEPEVVHLELNYTLPMSGRDLTLAFALQSTDEAGGFLPEDRVSLGASTELLKSTTVGVELWFDEDYSESKGGTGNDSSALVVQIATGF